MDSDSAHCLSVAGMLLQQDLEVPSYILWTQENQGEAEKQYNSSKLELLSIVCCVERLKQMLLGITI